MDVGVGEGVALCVSGRLCQGKGHCAEYAAGWEVTMQDR